MEDAKWLQKAGNIWLAFSAIFIVVLSLGFAAFYQNYQNPGIPIKTPEVKGKTDQLHLVSRVIDGDTIVLSDGNKVRYIGIDTPEIGSDSLGECFARESLERNKELVENKLVALDKDTSETDRFGRLLRYVYMDNQMVNEILVEEGYAISKPYLPDVKYQGQLDKLQEQAKLGRRGLWGACQIKK